jgi:NAD(P)H-dependent FMN reductase
MKSAMKLNVLGVGASMREQSYSTATLKIILERVSKNEAETKLLDLRLTRLPMLYSTKDGAKELIHVTELVKWADAFILSTPDYHGSMSAPIKNFLDHFWSEFAGKVFGYIVASHEKGLTAMDQMRTAVRQCYGWSMPYGLSVNPEEDFDDSGNLVSEKLSNRVDMVARDLVIYGKIIRQQFVNDLTQKNIVNSFASYYKKNE